MKTLNLATIAAAAAFAFAPATAQAQDVVDDFLPAPTQTCEQALGSDASILPANGAEDTCCFVMAERDYYLEKGIQVGGTYQGLGLRTYMAVECPATGAAAQSLGAETAAEDIGDGTDNGDDGENGDDNGED